MPSRSRLAQKAEQAQQAQQAQDHVSTMAAPSTSSRPFGRDKPLPEGFLVVVTGKLAPGHIDKFLEAFRPLAAHVAQHEGEGCLAYELSVGADDPDSFIIYERYTSKQFVEHVHFQSEPFKAFQAWVQGAGLEWVQPLQVSMYQERAIGFA